MFEISDEVIKWQLKYGRHDLPWQTNRTPYTVWISEIMLQQTQVATVRDYFTRFITVYPNVAFLASASEDQVLTHWSGLGYYSRARNLLKAARLIIDLHDGSIPSNFKSLMNLPGIGRSTAGAILTLAFQKKYPILDGNVKRVLARVFCVDGPANSSTTNRALWMHAENLLPDTDVDTYTQGLMDLGATVCTRRDPTCAACPLTRACKARLNKLVDVYPMSSQKKSVRRKSVYMIIFVRKSKALIIKNSGSGLWPGLWGFVDSDTFSKKTLDYFAKNLELDIQSVSQLDSFRHRLTHIDYSVHPIKVTVSSLCTPVDRVDMKWVDPNDKNRLPISVPVRRILNSMC